MSDKPKPGGYVWEQEVRRAQQAHGRLHKILERLLTERPGMANYVADAACALNTASEALSELERITHNGERKQR